MIVEEIENASILSGKYNILLIEKTSGLWDN